MGKVALKVADEEAGLRLDHYLKSKIEGTSRSKIQQGIRAGCVTVDGKIIRQPSRLLRTGEEVLWEAPVQPLLTPTRIDLAILYEDEEIVVVDKPAGLVVHPGAGQSGTTLVEGLLVTRSLPRGDDPARPGIVHRLDKETSGLIVVAKTPSALESLKAQFAMRRVAKHYLAQVEGIIPEEEGLIDAPIGRDPTRPSQMAIHPQGRKAQTGFHVLHRQERTTLLLVLPHTGRTHQIRVHLRYIGHPIVGDPVYGQKAKRLLLHAWRLTFTHPASGEQIRFEAPVPPEFPVHPYQEIPWYESQHAGNQSRQDNQPRSRRRERNAGMDVHKERGETGRGIQR